MPFFPPATLARVRVNSRLVPTSGDQRTEVWRLPVGSPAGRVGFSGVGGRIEAGTDPASARFLFATYFGRWIEPDGGRDKIFGDQNAAIAGWRVILPIYLPDSASLRTQVLDTDQLKTGLAPWVAGATIGVQQAGAPAVSNGFGYVCSTAGVSGDVEPTWPLVPGTVADGSAVWTFNGALFVVQVVTTNYGATDAFTLRCSCTEVNVAGASVGS